MFTFVKRLAPFSKFRTRVLTPPALISHQSFAFSLMRPNQLAQTSRNPHLLCYSFSSSQDIKQNTYEADLVGLKYIPQDWLSSYKKTLNMYTSCKDMSVLTYQDILKITEVLYELFRNQQRQGNDEKAKSYLIETIDLLRKHGPKDHIELAKTHTRLADVYLEQNDFINARDCYIEAIRICKLHPDDVVGPNFLSSSLTSLAKCYTQMNEKSKLYDVYRLVIENANASPNRELLIEAYENLGFVLNLSGETEKANDYLQKALEITTQQFGEQSEQAFYSYSRLARVFQSQGNADKAFYYSEKALQAGLQVFPADPEGVADRYSQLRGLL